MVTYSATPPVTGVDANGNPVTMVVDGNLNSLTMIDSNSATPNAASSTSWTELSIESLETSAAGLVGLGYGVNDLGQVVGLTFTNVSGQWVVGKNEFQGTDLNAIEYLGGQFYVADNVRKNIYQTTFNYSAPSPTGGIAEAINMTPMSSVEINVRGLQVLGSNVIGYSKDYSGTWTTDSLVASGDWNHNVGEVNYANTGVLKTSYTFPGYAGANAQVQYINAADPGEDNVPTIWNPVNASNSVSFSGVTAMAEQDPHIPMFSFNWL